MCPVNSEQGASGPFLLFSFTVFVTGVLALALSWTLMPAQMTIQLALLVIAALVLENFALWLPSYSISLAYPLAMGAIVLAGPAAAGLVAVLCSTNYEDFKSKTPIYSVAYNVGQLALATSVAGWAYVMLGGRVLYSAPGYYQPMQASDFPKMLLPMAVAAIVFLAVNIPLTAIYDTLRRSEPLWGQLRAMLVFVPTQVALAFVGYLMAQVLAINPIGLPLFIAPLVVAQQLYSRYAALKSAYVDTVRSLIGALEAKDPYTRGHSERVAEYASEIGSSLGLDATSQDRLVYAALLHDLGKLAVPSEVLTKPGRLDTNEIEFIRDHPTRGAEMVSRIPPLRDLAEFVRLHHEWYGGGGYPAGLDSTEIPQIALILSVADCYDAMTTTRAYRAAMPREAAVAELIRCAGTQFDPEIVRALIEARIGVADSEEAADALPEGGSTGAVAARGM